MPINMQTFRRDLTAGLTGALVGTPQAMGFALIAGISPIYGLYTAVVATIVASLIIRSPLLSVSPTNALALMVASTLISTAGGAANIDTLFTLTLLTGLIMLAFGLLQLQQYVRFVSHAVMTGFISGAALLIIMGQLSNLTGYQADERAAGAIPRAFDWLTNVQGWDITTMVLGVLAIAIMLLLRGTPLRYFSALIAVASVSGIAYVINLESVRVVADIAPIPAGLPGFVLPDLGQAAALLPAAFSMALLALVQSAGITQSVPEMDDVALEDNRDFVGQGLANIVGAFFQGMPAGGSLSRTAVNISAGARTRLANVLSGVFIGLTLIFLNGAAEQIVLAALAAQLILAALSLVRPKDIMHVYRVSRTGRWAMLATFAATLTLPLEYSIYIGVLVHLGQYVFKASDHLTVIQLQPGDEPNEYIEQSCPQTLQQPVTILSIHGNLYYAGVPRLKQQLPAPGDMQSPMVILRLRNVSYLGTTGIRLLIDYAAELEARGGKLILAGVSQHIERQLSYYEDVELIQHIDVYPAQPAVFRATAQAAAHARRYLHNPT